MAETDILKARLGQWWQTLDPATKAMFDTLYAAQPDLVIQTVSGGALNGGDGAASLTAFIGEVDPFARPFPVISPADTASDPDHPNADAAFKIKWNDYNSGQLVSGAYTDVVTVTNLETEQVVAQVSVAGAALEPEGRAAREADIPGLPSGSYNVAVHTNTEGGLPGGVPTDAGWYDGTSIVISVGTADHTAPSSPMEADMMGVQGAMEAAYQLFGHQQLAAAHQLEAMGTALREFARVTDDVGLQAQLIREAGRFEGATQGLFHDGFDNSLSEAYSSMSLLSANPMMEYEQRQEYATTAATALVAAARQLEAG